jgi:hypothetical protein
MVHEEEKSNCSRLPVCFPAKNDERLFLLFDEWSRTKKESFGNLELSRTFALRMQRSVCPAILQQD